MHPILRILIASLLILALDANIMLAQENTGSTVQSSALRQSLADAAGKTAEALDTPEGKFLDQLVMNGLPSAYSEFLGAMQNAGQTQFTAEAWKGGKIAADLARSSRWMDTMNKLNTALGRAAAVVDITSKAAAGEGKEVAISGVITILGELSNIPGGKAIMEYTKVTPPIISAATMAFVIWRESAKQLEEATQSVATESMYYSIERMCRVTSGRNLGEGDPIPVNSENIEKVWNRILTDSTFRGAFANYVTVDLEKEFPEPGWFDTVNEYIYGVSATVSGAGTSPKGGFTQASATGLSIQSTAQDRLDEKTVKSLEELKSEFKPYIASLLSTMNRAEKTKEQGVIAMKVAAALAGDLDRGSKTLESGLGRVMLAATRLGSVTVYANSCQAEIKKAVAAKDFQSLLVHQKMITGYVKDVIAWIPATGPLAAERNAAYDKMKSGYDAACKGLDEIKAEVRKKIEKPDLPKEAQGAQMAVSPESLYREYMAGNLTPFDWAGTAGPEAVKANFIAQLTGQKGKGLARIVSAWEQENFAFALQDLSKTSSIPLPEYKDTIAGYKQKLSPSFSYPAALADYKPQEDAQRAWATALQMYNAARDLQVNLVYQDHQETLAWLKNALAEYNSLLEEMGKRAQEIRSSFPYIFAPTEALIQRIDSAEKWLTENPSGIPVLSTPDKGSYGAFDMYVLPRDVAGKLGQLRFYTNDHLMVVTQEIDNAIMEYEKSAVRFDAALRDARPDDQTIRDYIDPNFLADEWFVKLQSERAAIPGYISALQARRDALAPKFQRQLDEIDADIFWVKRAGVNWDVFTRKMTEHNIAPVQTNGAQYFLPNFARLEESGSSAAIVSLPHPHLLTDTEKNKILTDLQGFYQSSNLRGFVTGCAQYLSDDFDTFFKAIQSAKTYPEENFFITCNNYNYRGKKFLSSKRAGAPYGGTSGQEFGLVTTSSLAAARAALAAAGPGSATFMAAVEKFKQELPLMIYINDIYAGDPLYQPNWGTSTIGPAYVALVAELNTKIKEHGTIILEQETRTRDENNNTATQKLPVLIAEMEKRLAKGNNLAQSAKEVGADDLAGILNSIALLQNFRTQEINAPPYQDFYALLYSLIDPKSALFVQAYAVLEKFWKLEPELLNLEKELEVKRNALTAQENKAVIDFYQAFKEAYELRDESAIMAMIGDDWEAGDGTTLADLQGYLRNSFTVFDQITYKLSQLTFTWNGSAFSVSYDLTITGRNFRYNLKHEEKSTVNEEVALDRQGKPRIVRTMNGRFWYVQ